MSDIWYALPAGAQDALLACALLVPVALGLALATRGLSVWPPVRALLLRHRSAGTAFVVLIALSVGVSTAILVQERGLRRGAARAADPFDVIVAAPGSEVTAMLAAVYLQSAALPLVPAARWREIVANSATRLAAPLAFGDSVDGVPLVGTTREFVRHLVTRTSPGDRAVDDGAARADALLDGRMFERADEVVVGAATAFALGDVLVPAHGTDAVGARHSGVRLTVTGRLPAGGTPWDAVVVAPVETLWLAHGLGDGHAAPALNGTAATGRVAAAAVASVARRTAGIDPIGPPFDPERMPGVPAIVVLAHDYAGAYALRGTFTDGRTMAFFPGEVLTRLYAVLGDVRQVVSTLALLTQLLVAVAVLIALSILVRGFARRFAMLRALGAPRRYTFAVVWSYALVLVVAGSAVGVALGAGASAALARVLAERTGVATGAGLSASDAVPLAAFVLAGAVLALAPAWLVARREPGGDLRG